MVGDSTRPEQRHAIYGHLLTAITHEVRSVFYNLSIGVGHSHTIYPYMRTLIGSCIRFTTIRESGMVTIHLHEVLIVNTLIGHLRHNRLTSMSEACYFVIDSLTLPQLVLEVIMILRTELIRTIEATLKGIHYSAASARDVIVVIDRFAPLFSILIHKLLRHMLQQETLNQATSLVAILLQDGHICSALRSAMNLQSNLDIITRLECRNIVSQLFGVLMLVESGRNRTLRTTLYARAGATRRSCVLTIRNILLTYFNTVDSSNLITGL